MKKFFYKVYDTDGNFVTSWNDVITEPEFEYKINASIGDLTLKIARKFDSFGEDEDVTLAYRVDIICIDKETPNGKIIYSGIISGYKPILSSGGEEVDITLLPFITTLEDDILQDGSNTTVSYISKDPNDIITDIITKYNGTITKNADNNVGVNISYSFNTITYLEAIKKCRELSSAGWFFYISPENILYFKKVSSIANHTLTIGKDILSIQPQKRIENIKNVVYFVGNSIFKKYERSGSISAYGRKAEVMQDQRVNVEATADIMATVFLDEHESPEIRTTIEVLDSNQNPNGYDIESFSPGDVVSIKGFGTDYPQTLWDISLWDVASWDYSVAYAVRNPMQIVSIKYSPNKVTLELSSKPIPIQNRIEDIYRKMKQEINNDNPTAPTT